MCFLSFVFTDFQNHLLPTFISPVQKEFKYSHWSTHPKSPFQLFHLFTSVENWLVLKIFFLLIYFVCEPKMSLHQKILKYDTVLNERHLFLSLRHRQKIREWYSLFFSLKIESFVTDFFILTRYTYCK